MSIVTQEAFDGVTAPSMPSGWVADNNFVTETTTFNSSPNGVTTTHALTTDVAFWNTSDDGNGGNAQASAFFHFTDDIAGGLAGYVFCRMTTPPTSLGGSVHLAGMTSYAAVIDISGSGFQLYRIVAGVASTISSLRSYIFTPGEEFILYCRCVGSTIILRVQRLSDSKWLDSSSNWQSSLQDAITVTNTAITGAGKAGIGMFRQTIALDIMFADDFLFESIVTAATRRRCSSTFF